VWRGGVNTIVQWISKSAPQEAALPACPVSHTLRVTRSWYLLLRAQFVLYYHGACGYALATPTDQIH
jgi:hypothetical protein